MCGRITIGKTKKELEEWLNRPVIIDHPEKLKKQLPLFNACPTDYIPVILSESQNRFTFVKWDYKNFSKIMKKPLINATSENIFERKTFIESIQIRRCVIPCDGYYEWMKINEDKIPYHLHLPDYSLFALPGIYETINWEGEQLTTCAIITQEAHSNIADIHDRMPAFLLTENIEKWLDISLSGEKAMELLKSYPENILVANEVTRHLNKVRDNTSDMIIPVSSEIINVMAA